jgi:Tfp pilus assembly protein PilF
VAGEVQRNRLVAPLAGVGILAALLIAGFAYSWGAHDKARREAALNDARHERFDRAEQDLRAAYDRNHDDKEVLRALARGYLAKDSLDDAERFLNRWIELEPNEIEPLELRAEFYHKRRVTEKAFADARHLAELDPGNFEYQRLAMLRAFEAGEFEAAETYCRECLKSRPDDPSLKSLLAQILRARRDPEGAAKVLDEMLAENPKNTRAILARAILYQENGDVEKAIPMLRTVLQLDHERQRTASYQLSMALEQAGEPEEAKKVMMEVRRRQDVELFKDAMANQPDNLDLKVRFAVSLLNDGHETDGEGLLEVVLARDPKFAPAHKALADYYEKKGEPSRAAKHRRLASQP